MDVGVATPSLHQFCYVLLWQRHLVEYLQPCRAMIFYGIKENIVWLNDTFSWIFTDDDPLLCITNWHLYPCLTITQSMIIFDIFHDVDWPNRPLETQGVLIIWSLINIYRKQRHIYIWNSRITWISGLSMPLLRKDRQTVIISSRPKHAYIRQ